MPPITIHVLWPTRGRPQLFARQFSAWQESQAQGADSPDVRYYIGIDSDDATTNQSPEVTTLLSHRAVTRVDMQPGGKIAAYNRLCQLVLGDGIVVLASDDMTPVRQHWDAIVSSAMQHHWPALDGALHFDDGYLGRQWLCTMSIMGTNYWRRFGYAYYPAYRSYFCDDEFTRVGRAMGRLIYDRRVIFRHDHIGRTPDAVFATNEAHGDADRLLFRRRLLSAFGMHGPTLSILIPTLVQREQMMRGLVRHLYSQIGALADHWDVELIVDQDRGESTVGAKRNQLLGQSRGAFVCYVDDDDEVDGNYVRDILSAIRSDPEADCVVFDGRMSIDGTPHKNFIFSLEFAGDSAKGDIYLRRPNHLCPVRRAIAIQAGFPSINVNEDSEYATRIARLLKRQVVVTGERGERKVLYHYRFRNDGTCTQNPRSRYRVLNKIS